MATTIGEAIERTRTALASAHNAGPAADKPASAVVERGLRCRVEGPDGWRVITDMPPPVGGEASAPTAGWVLRAAWAACDATAIAMRAAELGVELTTLEVTAESESDFRGLLGVGDDVAPGPARARIRVRIGAANADPEQLREIVSWADRHSPVGDALRRSIPAAVEVETVP
jgi:uncharacterized OsmC-like protein